MTESSRWCSFVREVGALFMVHRPSVLSDQYSIQSRLFVLSGEGGCRELEGLGKGLGQSSPDAVRDEPPGWVGIRSKSAERFAHSIPRMRKDNMCIWTAEKYATHKTNEYFIR